MLHELQQAQCQDHLLPWGACPIPRPPLGEELSPDIHPCCSFRPFHLKQWKAAGGGPSASSSPGYKSPAPSKSWQIPAGLPLIHCHLSHMGGWRQGGQSSATVVSLVPSRGKESSPIPLLKHRLVKCTSF